MEDALHFEIEDGGIAVDRAVNAIAFHQWGEIAGAVATHRGTSMTGKRRADLIAGTIRGQSPGLAARCASRSKLRCAIASRSAGSAAATAAAPAAMHSAAR